ncbi:MAG: hypothetical protein HY787_18720 [Deltaproteobacteria bacterium]|nr:hypothetical protein [Deltaproteobacteria bacterium]
MNTNSFSRAVRGLYYRQRLFSDTHRLENEVKSFLIVHRLKKITVSSLKVELKRGRLIITKAPLEDRRQLKLSCVV